MISVLIAGSYTPICLITFKGLSAIRCSQSYGELQLQDTCKSILGKLSEMVLLRSLYRYGWTCVIAFTKLLDTMSPGGFGWLLAAGIVYTIGGIIYALKLPLFNNKHKNFGSHEIFHLFVMGGSVCHFIVMYVFLLR